MRIPSRGSSLASKSGARDIYHYSAANISVSRATQQALQAENLALERAAGRKIVFLELDVPSCVRADCDYWLTARADACGAGTAGPGSAAIGFRPAQNICDADQHLLDWRRIESGRID